MIPQLWGVIAEALDKFNAHECQNYFAATHHVNILEINGESYRLSQSRSRNKTAAE